MRRPVGVLIIGILGIIAGVLQILGSFAIMGVGGLAAVAGAGGVGAGTMAVGVIYLIVGVLTLIFAIAFISLRRWAWWGYVLMLGLAIVFGVVGLAVNGFYASSLMSVIIDVLLMLYMNSRRVKQAFFGAR
jgi:hypothetical protein